MVNFKVKKVLSLVASAVIAVHMSPRVALAESQCETDANNLNAKATSFRDECQQIFGMSLTASQCRAKIAECEGSSPPAECRGKDISAYEEARNDYEDLKEQCADEQEAATTKSQQQTDALNGIMDAQAEAEKTKNDANLEYQKQLRELDKSHLEAQKQADQSVMSGIEQSNKLSQQVNASYTDFQAKLTALQDMCYKKALTQENAETTAKMARVGARSYKGSAGNIFKKASKKRSVVKDRTLRVKALTKICIESDPQYTEQKKLLERMLADQKAANEKTQDLINAQIKAAANSKNDLDAQLVKDQQMAALELQTKMSNAQIDLQKAQSKAMTAMMGQMMGGQTEEDASQDICKDEMADAKERVNEARKGSDKTSGLRSGNVGIRQLLETAVKSCAITDPNRKKQLCEADDYKAYAIPECGGARPSSPKEVAPGGAII